MDGTGGGSAAPVTVAVCQLCKGVRELVTYDETIRQGRCADCVGTMPLDSRQAAALFLMATIPFKVGDRVEVRLAGELYEGVGVVREVSTDLEHGATLVHPTFKIEMLEKAYSEVPAFEWATENCLTRVEEPK